MVDSASNDTCNNCITKAITDIWNNSKHPYEKAITDYVIKNFSLNIDESFIENIIKKLLDQNVLENKPSCKGNSFFIGAKENLEDTMNHKMLTPQIPMSPIPELCDTPQRKKRKKTE